MKINKFMVLFLLFILFIFTASSQISQVTNTISVEEVKACTTSFYDEVQNVYGNCIYYSNSTNCLNTSGPNTACSLTQSQINYTCKTGEVIINKNKTDCQPPTKFRISINKGAITEKKEIDFSDWGVCVNSTENNCLIVTCQSKYDGANDGQFHGCKGGTTCQRFEICDNDIRTFYKNSRNGFVSEDPTFHLPKLAYKEVGE